MKLDALIALADRLDDAEAEQLRALAARSGKVSSKAKRDLIDAIDAAKRTRTARTFVFGESVFSRIIGDAAQE